MTEERKKLARYEQIAMWANDKKWTKGVELGVFDGRTHFFLVDNCPALTVYGVDVWDMPGFREGPTKSREFCECEFCNETRASRRKSTNMTERRLAVIAGSDARGNRSMIMRMTTRDAATAFDGCSLDFVFVDADHSTEGVRADIELFYPKIRAGGYLIGHDWNMQSVRDGVLHHFQQERIKIGDDHLWWVEC